MADPSLEFQELFPAPRRRRSPRVAIVFLPFTLTAMLLFWVFRGLWLSFWQAVGTTLRAAWWCWWVGLIILIGWAILWWAGDHDVNGSPIQTGCWYLLVGWPWHLGVRLFVALHMQSAAGWWNQRYLHIAHLWYVQQLDNTPLLSPAAAYVALLVAVFLVTFCRRLLRTLRPGRR